MLKRISKRILISLALGLVLVFALIGAFYFSEFNITSNGKVVKIVPSTVEAASNPTVYTTQGSSDNLVWQQALNALSTNGGEIDAQAGSYITDVGSVVSRAINYVTIAGQGLGTYYAGTISVGTQTGWIFRDIKIDSITGTGSYTLQNAMVAGVYYTYYTSALGNVIGETATQELDNKTLDSSVAKGTWTASGTWTIPAVTLSGNVDANSKQILNLDTLKMVGGGVIRLDGVDNSTLHISGGADMNAAAIRLRGKDHPTLPGRLELNTPNSALNEANRMLIEGAVDTAAVTWMNCTHSGLVLSNYISVQPTYGLVSTVDNSYVLLKGGYDATAPMLFLSGKDDAVAGLTLYTPNATKNANTARLTISGASDIANALFSNTYIYSRIDVAGDSVPLTLQNLSGSGTPKVFFNMSLSQGVMGQVGAFVGQPANNGGALNFLIRNGVTGYMSEVLRLTTEYSNAGTIKFPTYGAGTLTTDASGNVTASSDERLKDIKGSFVPGLKEVLHIDPILYKWNSSTGLDTVNTYAGFSAQNVMQYIPQAVGLDSNGYYTLNDRAIIAALVNSVKELQDQIDSQAGSTYNKAVIPDTSQTKIIKSPERPVLIGPPAPTPTPIPTINPIPTYVPTPTPPSTSMPKSTTTTK